MATKELTVKALKAILAVMPDDALIVLSKDIEGNEFSPLCTYSTGMYAPGAKPWQKGEFFDEGDPTPNNC